MRSSFLRALANASAVALSWWFVGSTSPGHFHSVVIGRAEWTQKYPGLEPELHLLEGESTRTAALTDVTMIPSL
jgi:hypothetical protein